MTFIEIINLLESWFWWLLLASTNSDEIIIYFLNFVDKGYIRFVKLFETTILFQFLLLVTEDNGAIINRSLMANVENFSHPVIIELFATYLNHGFKILQAFEILGKGHIADLTTANKKDTIWEYLWPKWEIDMQEDWYINNMFLIGYYNAILGNFFHKVQFDPWTCLPVYGLAAEYNPGLEFDMTLQTRNYNQLYYQEEYDSFRYHYLKHYNDNGREFEVKEFESPTEPLIELYEDFTYDDYIENQIKWKTYPEEYQFYRSDKLFYEFDSYVTGEKFGMSSDYVVTVWDYINESDLFVEFFADVRWYTITQPWWARDWWLYGPYEYWIEFMLGDHIWAYYKLNDFIQEIQEEIHEAFDFGDKTNVEGMYADLEIFNNIAMIHGSLHRDWWVYFLFNKWEMVGATTLLSGDLNILKHEPHLEYERIYSFIMSNMDETQVKIYTEKYKDYTFDRPHTTYNVYGTLQEMREKHALHELPIKADHLIYYFNIYEKSDKFCAIYLDWSILFYRISHLQDTLLYFYSYYCSWLNPYPYSRLKPIFDRICYIIWLYISTPIDYLHWKYSDEVYSWFFIGFIMSIGYFFNSLVKILLPHNFLYLLRGQSLKKKNNKNNKNKDNDIRKKITNYSLEDIENYKHFLTEFFSKINNLESWIFSIDTTNEKKNKIFNFLKLDKNSKKAYFDILKKNKNIMYKKLSINEHINFFKNTNKLRYFGKYIQLVSARRKWGIVRLFLKFVVSLWSELHYGRVRNDADEVYSNTIKWKPRIPWTIGYSKLVFMWWGKPGKVRAPIYSIYTLLLAILKLITYWMVYFIYIYLIWKYTSPDINKFHTERQATTENVYFKGLSNINKWLNSVDMKLEDVNKKIFNFNFQEFKKPKSKWLHYWQKDHLDMIIYSLKETPGARLYYYWVLFGRLFLLLFNKQNKLNIVRVSWKSYTLKYSYLRFKNYVAFLYWEYLIYRGEIKALNNFGFKFFLIVEFFFGFLMVILLAFIIYGWFWIIWLILIYFKERYLTYNIQSILAAQETKKSVRLLMKISTFFFSFWYILYKNPKTNEGLIISFYIKILYPLIKKLYWGYFVSQHQFKTGYDEKNVKVGLYKVFFYWSLLLRVFVIDLCGWIYNRFIYLIRWVILEFKIARLIIGIKNQKKNLLKLVNILKNQNINSMKFLFLNYLVSCFDYEVEVNMFHIFERLYKTFMTNLKISIILIIKIIHYILSVYSEALAINSLNMYMLFYYEYLYVWDKRIYWKWLRLRYLYYPNKHIYLKAWRILFKKNWKKGLHFLFLQTLDIIGVSLFIYKKNETYFMYKKIVKGDGQGYINRLKKVAWMPKFIKKYLISIHVFIYFEHLTNFFTVPDIIDWIDARSDDEKIPFNERNTKERRIELRWIKIMRVYVKFIQMLNAVFKPYLSQIEKIYRYMDNDPLTRHWSLTKRFIFLRGVYKARILPLKNAKKDEKIQDKFVKKELSLRKKALRKFHYKAFWNFIGFWFIKGKIFYEKPGYIKKNRKKIKIEEYLDYNIENVHPAMWFLVILFSGLFLRIMKYVYSGEKLMSIWTHRKKGEQRIGLPNRINNSGIAQIAFRWVYTSGRYVIRILYTPVANWPLRFVVSLFSMMAERKTSENKYWEPKELSKIFLHEHQVDKNNYLPWLINWALGKRPHVPTIFDKTDYENIDWEKWYPRIQKEVTLNDLNINLKHLGIKEFSMLGKYFTDWYTGDYRNIEELQLLDEEGFKHVKDAFALYIKADVPEPLFIKFFNFVLTEDSTGMLLKEYRMNLSDIFDLRFANFLKEYRHVKGDGLKLTKVMLTNAEALKSNIARSKKMEEIAVTRYIEKLKLKRENVQSISEFEEWERMEEADYENWVDNAEKELVNACWKKAKEDGVNKTIPWFKDVYWRVSDRLDEYGVKRIFELSDMFFHWREFTTSLRMYVQWYLHLEEESKVNEEVDEGALLGKVWANMIAQGQDYIYTDGGSVINGYYKNSWVYLFHYFEWAKDENFDFGLQMYETVQSVFLHNSYVTEISDKYFTRSVRFGYDMITHSPLHYYKYFDTHKKWTRKYFWLRWISFFSFFYVLFFLPGEYVLNCHLLTIPFGVWVTTTILYRFFKDYNKILNSNGAYFYKLSWRKYNPFWYSEDETAYFLKTYKKTYTRHTRYLWENWFLGPILWIFTASFYALDWYETEAWRHRWFPWDYSRGGVSLNDLIHDDGFDRVLSGKNYFSLPYANTFRYRRGWDFIPLDGPWNHQHHPWDWIACTNKEFPLNPFIEKCTFYIDFFICSDKMRHRHPLSDITRDRVTPMEFMDYVKWKINNLTSEKSSKKEVIKWDQNGVADILFTDDENREFLYAETKDFSEWYNYIISNWTLSNWKLLFEKIKLQLEQLVVVIQSKSNEYFSLDMRDRMDVFDYYYFHFSCYIYKYFVEIYQYIEFIWEFFKNLF